ncbi:MAG: hypothetical protein ACRD0U_15825 [Acidimicrobiales bacterium]
MTDADTFEPEDVAAAERLDRQIEAALSDRPTAPVDQPIDLATVAVVAQLTAGLRAAAPPRIPKSVAATVRRAEFRAWAPVRVAAMALASVLAVEGIGNLVNGEWVARNLEQPYDAHPYFEGGVVLIALGAVLAAGAFRRQWLDPAALAGVPAALVLSVHGLPELAEFPAGGLLHLTQGLAAVLLAAAWWRARRRYARRRRYEGVSW